MFTRPVHHGDAVRATAYLRHLAPGGHRPGTGSTYVRPRCGRDARAMTSRRRLLINAALVVALALGDTVAKGDVLGTLEDDSAQDAIDAAQDAVTEAQAQVATARLTVTSANEAVTEAQDALAAAPHEGARDAR